MSLMEGGEAQFQQMKESGAIQRTTNRILAAVRALNFTVEYIVGLFTGLWQGLRLSDLANPPALFRRVIATFAQPVRRLVAFVIEIIKIVVEVILQIMQFPTDLIANILNRAMAAWDRIKRDPIGFLKNLLRAIKQGFVQFFDNIVDHLLFGLTGWLMSELRDAGVPALTDFSLRGVISWVLQVLNISMEAIWQKLAAHPRIGPERVARLRGLISRAEGIWTFIRDVQERGITAIWEKIQEQLSNLWDTILDSVKNWIMREIVEKITVRLLSMLDPTGIMAVINSAIALYRAIQSFIRYLRQILEVVNSFVEGLAEIAAGNIAVAANFLEGTMRRAMPIVIGFLANQVGLSGIGRRIGEMIMRVRTMVDEALTWLVNKAVDTGFALFERLLAAGRSAVGAIAGWLGIRKQFTLANGETHEIYMEGTESSPQVMVASTNPRSVEAMVRARRAFTPAPTPAQNGFLTQALAKKGQLDSFIAANRTSTAGGGSSTASLQSGIGTRLDGIKQDLVQGDAIPAATTLPLTNITYSTDGGKGKTVIARPLSRLPGNTRGSRPPGGNPNIPLGWQHVLVIDGPHPTNWVRAHLVNEQLHGPGEAWNLVPGTQLLNSQMRDGAEKWAKDEIAKDELIHYKAEVTGWHTISGNALAADYFPSNITVTYGYLVNPAKGKTQETTLTANYSQGPPPPTAAAPTGPPNINTMSRDALRLMFAGVGSVDTIFTVRNGLPNRSFRDLAHMYLRLRDAYNNSAQFNSTFWPLISGKYNFENAFTF
jgi:phage-related protein